MEQDLSKLDVTKLHPLSPEVISRQATINIGKVARHITWETAHLHIRVSIFLELPIAITFHHFSKIIVD